MGVQKSKNLADVICERSLIIKLHKTHYLVLRAVAFSCFACIRIFAAFITSGHVFEAFTRNEWEMNVVCNIAIIQQCLYPYLRGT